MNYFYSQHGKGLVENVRPQMSVTILNNTQFDKKYEIFQW